MKTRREGFTMIETIVSVVLLGILGVITTVILVEAMDFYTRASVRMSLSQEARESMQRMLREMRTVDYRASASSGSKVVLTAAASEVQFVDSSNNNITFGQSGTTVRRSGDGQSTWDTLCNNVSSLVFTYYDSSNAILSPLPLSATNRDAVRCWAVELTLSAGGQTIKLRGMVFPRDLGQ